MHLVSSSSYCDDTPSAPRIRQLLQDISLLGRWSTSGSDRGIAHFFIATRNTIKGMGGKRTNKQTNNMSSGWLKVQEEELCNIAFPMCICRLTLAVISTENSTTHKECWLILTGLPHCYWTISHADWSLLLSGVDWPLASPFSNSFSEFPCPTPLALTYPLLVASRSRVQTLCLFWCETRQRDRLLGGPPT